MNAINAHAIAAVALAAGLAGANPVDGWYVDLPNCDTHGDLEAVEELGVGFPTDELIDTTWYQTDLFACSSDDPDRANVVVAMINLSGRHWDNLFYVADFDDTFMSNYDGLAEDLAAPVGGWVAFRIDSTGVNRPLIFESMTPDGIFEPGEIWEFIIDDYTNAFGVPPSLMSSFGFAGASSTAFGTDPSVLSSGSIVQMVPTPASIALLGAGALFAARRRRN